MEDEQDKLVIQEVTFAVRDGNGVRVESKKITDDIGESESRVALANGKFSNFLFYASFYDYDKAYDCWALPK